MKGKAIVDGSPLKANGKQENCQGTTNGVLNIDRWIGDTKWDVIHFNFGLHDLKHIDPVTGKKSVNLDYPRQADIKQYKKNMEEIIGKLKATGATLIFATTTPYPDKLEKQVRSPGMFKEYNEVALKIMKKNCIVVNDLNAFVLPQMESLMRADNIHFTEVGYKALAERVAKSITEHMK